MTLSEFKAWFEGFTETLEGPPDAKQWKRIQARVKEITGNPITERVYIERWPYRAYFSAGTCNVQGGVGHTASLAAPGRTGDFDSHRALYAAGAAEFNATKAA